MASHDQCVSVSRVASASFLIAALCLVCVVASACFARASCGAASDALSEPSEMVGKEVMISFKWSERTSVLESLTLVGTLIRADGELLVVNTEGRIGNEYQEQQLDALERHGKIKRDPDGHTVYVFRTEIARLRLHPEI